MTKKPPAIGYKQLNSELDDILAKLQSADLDIDESLVLHDQGMKIIEKLQAYLYDAENKVSKVKKSWEK